MNLFTKQRVVKSYAVSVAGACLVDSQFAEFQGLREHLTVLKADAPPLDSQDQECDNLASPFSFPIQETAGDFDEAGNILLKAQEEAAEIIRRAEAQALEIGQKAERDLEQRRKELESQVRSEIEPLARADGYQAGYQEGYQQGLTEAEQILDKAKALLQLTRKALEEEYGKADEYLLRLAVRMAERIIHSSLKVEPELLLEIVRSLILLPQDKEDSLLHVSPGDADWLSELSQESLPCPWVADDTLVKGDCFLECREGIYDARLTGQLSKFEEALLEELKHGGLEPSGREGQGN